MSTTLVSNVPLVAPQTDTSLINPVDIASDKCGKIWVSILAGNLVQQYDRKCGKKLASMTVTTPTGLDFHRGVLYIASQNGTVYTPGQSSTTPTPYLSVTGGGSLWGLAWHRDMLYVTVYDRGYVGVYKDKMPVLSIVNDGLVSFSFRPLGIRSLGDRIYITYSDMSTSVGSGYVDVYNPKCETLTNLIARDALAYPYGLALCDGKLLVGNRGSGRIWAYDKETGERMEDVTRSVNDGLMGLLSLDGLIYFVAANDGGLMGSLGFVTQRH